MSATDQLLDSLSRAAVVAEVCLVVAFVPLVVRLWCRARLLNNFHTDDWTILASYVCFCAVAALLIHLVHDTSDILHGGAVNLAELKNLVLAGLPIYILGMVLLKISLGAFFLRIFSIQRFQRYVIFAVIGTTILLSIAYIVLTSATCGAWAGYSGLDPHCKFTNAVYAMSITWSSWNAGGDLVYAILALDALMSIRMRRLTRFYASTILLLGTFGGVASIVRLAIVIKNFRTTTDTLQTDSGIWTLVEMCIGITAANLACLRPVLRLIRQKLRRNIQGSDPSTPRNRQHMMGLAPPVTFATEAPSHLPGARTELYMLSSTKFDKDWTTTRPENTTADGVEIQRPQPVTIKTPDMK